MPNGAPLQQWKDRGRKVVYIAWLVLFVETIVFLALTALYGIFGIGISLFMLNATLLVIVMTLQNQIDAIDGALRGVRDESDYSLRIMKHLRRELTLTGEGAGPRGPA